MRGMKDSGFTWIGKVPEDWSMKRVKHIFTRKNEKAMQENPVVLSLARAGIRERDISNNEGQIAESYFNYNPVDINDLLLNPMDLYSGANCSISKVKGVISPAYINLRGTNDVNPVFYDYYFKVQYWVMAFFSYGKGVSFDNRWTLNADTLMNYPVVSMPYDEQCKRADYLDTKCSKIDAIIAREQAVIEKLKEYKQILISEAVRHGIHGEELQSSRYFWIDSIPQSWKVGQLKYFATIRSGITMGKKYPNNSKLVDIPYLRVANVQGEYVDLSDIATISVLPEEVEKYCLKADELLMTEGGDRDKLGRGCVWKGEINPCLHQNHVFAVSTDSSRLLVHFLDYVTTSDIARNYFEYTAKKTTNLASTNSTTILQFRIPIPPVAEQQEIVDYLDTRCTKINQSIKGCKIIMDKLTEYKKTLIYEVVTGKREV